MHIPDGFLDPKISTGLLGAASFALSFCLGKVKEMATALQPMEALAVAGRNITSLPGRMKRVLTGEGEQLIYRIGMVASLVFAAQMFNFPISQGTSGHLIGGVFAAVVLGPFAGMIAMTAVLLIQSFFFADGGLLALGANIINMAVIGALLCYYVYFFLKKVLPEWSAIFISAWVSVFLAAFACALEIGFSGTAPYSTVVPAMLRVHFIIGIAEGLITLALINLFRSMIREKA